MRGWYLLWLSVAVWAAGCKADDEGILVVTAYGESFIEDGIPASEVDDGWAVTFERFVVEVREVRVAGIGIPVEPRIDLVEPAPDQDHELGGGLVPSGEHSGASFRIARVEVEGSATKGDDTRSFHWIFEEPTDYTQCDTTTSVGEGHTARFQITVHADHLFYDSLVAENPRLRFQPLADADADADGEITRAELQTADIGAYDPGSEGGIEDLWSWLVAQTRTLGHVDGEGHCQSRASSD